MKPVGGFFELELSRGDSLYHDSAVQLTTGRACLSYILQVLKPSKVYVPYYCCDALYEPMELQGIDFEFYSISKTLEPEQEFSLTNGEYLIYCNFFGIKSGYTDQLLKHYGDKLIVDNTHAFFHRGFEMAFSFTSARKYFGVPDGAFLYGPQHDVFSQEIKRNDSLSIIHNYHRLIGKQDQAFQEFLEHEKSLGSEVERISIASELLLSNVNYAEVRQRRKENFKRYRAAFGAINTLAIDSNEDEAFCYPLLLERPVDRSLLYPQKIFIPNYWLDTTQRLDAKDYVFEDKLSTELLPLPVDHRYTKEEINRVITAIKALIG